MKRPSGSPSATPTPIPTTGLANRRELMRSLTDALESRAGGVFLVLDLDHFKRINDLHGHLAGDKVLLRVAEASQKSSPTSACCARTGGDEFAVLLPGANAETGRGRRRKDPLSARHAVVRRGRADAGHRVDRPCPARRLRQ